MKRESAAERALKGQVKRMEIDFTRLNQNIAFLSANRDQLALQMDAIESEISRLEAQRRTASESRK